MPNWKKVIVSGSDAVLSSLTTSGNITSSGDLSVSGEVSSSTIVASGDITTHTVSTISSTIDSDNVRTVDTFATSTYNGAIYDYILISTGVGARTGQFIISQDNNAIEFTDLSTKHLADPVIPEITADINSGNVRVRVTKGNGYTFKAFAKKL